MRIWLIYVTNFFLTSAVGVVFVFLEDIQTNLNLSDLAIGVIAATGFAAALVTQLALSPLADQGRIAPLAFVAIAAGIIGPIGLAFGQTLLVLALSRGLSGIALGLFGLLARKALLGLDATGGGAKLGVLLSTAVAGFIAGPLIGALFEPLGFAAPFLAVSAAVALAGIPATRMILKTAIAAAPVDYSDLRLLVRRPRVQAAMMVQAVVFGFIGIFDAIIDRFLTDLGGSTTTVAVVIVCIGAPLLVLPRLAGKLAEERGGSAVMIPAVLILIPSMIGYGLAGSVAVVIVFGVMHGSTESFASIGAQVLVLEVTGAERAAVGSALLETAGLLSATLAAFFAPTIYGAQGQTLFLAAAASGTVLALLAVLRVRVARQQEWVTAQA